jgi:hypothetical protein
MLQFKQWAVITHETFSRNILYNSVINNCVPEARKRFQGVPTTVLLFSCIEIKLSVDTLFWCPLKGLTLKLRHHKEKGGTYHSIQLANSVKLNWQATDLIYINRARRPRLDSWQGQGIFSPPPCPDRLRVPPRLLSNGHRKGVFPWG